jgi:hypothetical protein
VFDMRRLLIAIGVGVLTLGVACSGTADRTTSGASPGGQEPAGGGSTSVDRVTVTGTVSQRLADEAFVLTDATVEEGAATISGELPVVVTGTTASVDANERVTVSGTLVRAALGDELRAIEAQVGVNVDDRILKRLEGGQLLVASSVQTG